MPINPNLLDELFTILGGAEKVKVPKTPTIAPKPTTAASTIPAPPPGFKLDTPAPAPKPPAAPKQNKLPEYKSQQVQATKAPEQPTPSISYTPSTSTRPERPLSYAQDAFRREFNIEGYHGTNPYDYKIGKPRLFDEFNLTEHEVGVHFGTLKAAHDIKIVDESGEGAQEGFSIYPLRARIRNPLALWDLGNWGVEKMRGALVASGKFSQREVDNAAELGIPGIRALLDRKGYDAIKYINTVEDVGSTSYMVWHPEQLRSPWADFDPFRKQSRNLMAGVAGTAAVPTVESLLGSDQAQAAEGTIPAPPPGFTINKPAAEGTIPAPPPGFTINKPAADGRIPAPPPGFTIDASRETPEASSDPYSTFHSIVSGVKQLGSDIADVFHEGQQQIYEAAADEAKREQGVKRLITGGPQHSRLAQYRPDVRSDGCHRAALQGHHRRQGAVDGHHLPQHRPGRRLGARGREPRPASAPGNVPDEPESEWLHGPVGAAPSH